MPPGIDLIAGGGTAALAVALSIAAWTLWKQLEKERAEAIVRMTQRIADLRTERDAALAGWREQTAATDRTSEALLRLTAAIEARNQLELEQRRSRR
jgi:hypothetical protein